MQILQLHLKAILIREIFKNPTLIFLIPRFIRKFQNVIAKQNSGIFQIFDKTAIRKEIYLYLI